MEPPKKISTKKSSRDLSLLGRFKPFTGLPALPLGGDRLRAAVGRPREQLIYLVYWRAWGAYRCRCSRRAVLARRRATAPCGDSLTPTCSVVSTAPSRTSGLGLRRKPEHLGTALPPSQYDLPGKFPFLREDSQSKLYLEELRYTSDMEKLAKGRIVASSSLCLVPSSKKNQCAGSRSQSFFPFPEVVCACDLSLSPVPPLPGDACLGFIGRRLTKNQLAKSVVRPKTVEKIYFEGNFCYSGSRKTIWPKKEKSFRD